MAIVRALEGLRRGSGDEPTLLVLDEPTVFLPENEVALLFDLVRQIAARGSSVLFVSHDLAEVRQITDRVTVLRDGRVAGTVVTAQTSPRALVNLILGQELQEMAASSSRSSRPVRGAQVRDLTTRWLHDVSFELRAGEVLGLTGLVGSGYEDSVYAIFGAIPAESGTLVVDGERRDVAAMTPQAAMAHGIALVPGDRQSTGSIPTLARVGQHQPAGARPLLPRRQAAAERARPQRAGADGRVRRAARAGPEMDYGSFSGGNQQKAMMAKWKQIKPKVMLLHEPTQGVDVGARQQIWTMIRAATATSSTICASSDYEQLAAICDRVGVVARGRLVGFLTGADVTKERIAEYCLSSSADASVTAADGSGG